jgi:hypothetical protein
MLRTTHTGSDFGIMMLTQTPREKIGKPGEIHDAIKRE